MVKTRRENAGEKNEDDGGRRTETAAICVFEWQFVVVFVFLSRKYGVVVTGVEEERKIDCIFFLSYILLR